MSIQEEIFDIVDSILPFDEVEREHIENTKDWIRSGVQIFRTQKPDIPPKHLVSFFVLFDERVKKILLIEHKKALEWLAPGGHIDLNEHPRDAARREAKEELGIEAEFFLPGPVLLTQRVTVGLTAGHTDVSLWYVLNGDSTWVLHFDPIEFSGSKWFSFDEVLKLDPTKVDPNLKRFVAKFQTMI